MDEITKICFSKDTCVAVSSAMQRHLKDVVSFRQFSVIVPTNEMFREMEKTKLKSLLTDTHAQMVFLQEHVFLGSLTDTSNHHRGLAYSISPNHSVLTMGSGSGERYLVHSDRRLLRIKQSIPVVEGMLHIVENTKY